MVSSRWYVILWNGGGKTLTVKMARSVGFTRILADAHIFESREAAWKVCRTSGSRRAVPECEEVVMRYLTQEAFGG